MGTVYRADDTVRGCTVALKRVSIRTETKHREELIAMFHREYRTLAELKHPRVIQVFDYGGDAEGPYYTMELLDGVDLSRQAPVPWRRACSLLRDVCSSLALLHSRGYVHRDVSPVNVRCTSDGVAKLIDFGALMLMGIGTLTVGTPPCVAPEALARQPLDGRADLFALGATLYFALTGRHAFPARTWRQLRVLQRRAPRPPSTLTPDVPLALDRLVLSLLSIDPMARPRHAAEVMERLTILADLAPLEQVAVHQAYLNTPALIGRDAVCLRLAERRRRALAGEGVVLRLHAAPGGGRTRLLHVSMMDARLSGMLVAHAACSVAGARPFGVVRALLTELRDAAGGSRRRLGKRPSLVPLLEDTDTRVEDGGTRETILKELSSLCIELAGSRSLMIAVDDIERCDEPSLAAVLTLASAVHGTSIELLYTDTTSVTGERHSAQSLLHELSEDIELVALDEEQTEALLGSVFGQVPNLATLTRHIFERAVGNPRSTMELAQSSVDRELARYELGSWSLPGQLASDALPASLQDVRRAKFDALAADPRELAQVLAIVDGYAIQLHELCVLTDHADAIRSAEAHEALLDARVVRPGDAQVVADRSWLEIVRQSVDAPRALKVYSRLSKLLEARGANPIQVARCLMRAGDAPRAVDVLCAALARGTMIDDSDSEYPELLQEADSQCLRLNRPPRESFIVQRELVALADRVELQGMDGYFHCVLRQLSRDSGLDDWLKLAGEVPEAGRLTQALALAQARYDATDERSRVLCPLDAVKGLVETVYAASIYAAVIGDSGLIESLPPLSPFEPLSPAVSAVTAAIRAQRALIGALYEQVLEVFVVRLNALNTGTTGLAGLTEAQLSRSRLLLHYALGSLQAGLGIKGALDNAQVLDRLPHGQILAAAVRENYCVRGGNTRGAQQWRRQRELLQIQQKRPHALRLRQATQQLECSSHADDLEETKRSLELLEELSEIYPCAGAYVHFGRGEYERIRGDHASGLRYVRLALDMTKPGVHSVWPWAAGCEVECLRGLHQLDEARAVGKQRVREASEAGLRVMRDHIETFLALVEGQLGLFESAIERLDRGIEYREFYGMHGLNLGWSYEARARVSLWRNDREGFERSVRSCAVHYQGGRDNPALAARYEHLMQAARETWQDMDQFDLADTAVCTSAKSSALSAAQTSMLHTLIQCKDRDERARMVLRYLLETTECHDGQLYLLREDGLSLAAGDAGSKERIALVQRLMGIEAQNDGEITITLADESTDSTTEGDTVEFSALLLTCERGAQVAMVGAVTLRSRPNADSGFYATARKLSHELIELGDVKPMLS